MITSTATLKMRACTIVYDCESRRNAYIEFDGIRLIVDGGEIVGWYRP